MKQAIKFGITLILITSLFMWSKYSEERMLLEYYVEYREIVEEMLNEEIPNISNVSIKFGQLEKGMIGMAFGGPHKELIDIVISRHYWKEMDDNERKILMFHELSHDYHEQRHCTEKTCIMYPSRLGMVKRDAVFMLKTAVLNHVKHRPVIRFNPFINIK